MINKIGVHLKVKNIKKSEEFYQNLGFKRVFDYGPTKKNKEDYNGIIFEHRNCRLEIADGHRAVKKSVFNETINSSKTSLMIYVDSLKDILKRCERYRIAVAVGPRHYYWGTLELVIKDPDGLVLVFIQPYSNKTADELEADETYAVRF